MPPILLCEFVVTHMPVEKNCLAYMQYTIRTSEVLKKKKTNFLLWMSPILSHLCLHMNLPTCPPAKCR